jgi:hypothetical protein
MPSSTLPMLATLQVKGQGHLFAVEIIKNYFRKEADL